MATSRRNLPFAAGHFRISARPFDSIDKLRIEADPRLTFPPQSAGTPLLELGDYLLRVAKAADPLPNAPMPARFGTVGNDTLTAGQVLAVYGLEDNDRINGLDAQINPPVIPGGPPMIVPGTDEIYGGGGNDSIYGHGDDDSLYGDAGDDLILGGDGNDTIRGEAWADTIYGGLGDDDLRGVMATI